MPITRTCDICGAEQTVETPAIDPFPLAYRGHWGLVLGYMLCQHCSDQVAEDIENRRRARKEGE